MRIRERLTKIIEPVFASHDHNDIDKAVDQILPAIKEEIGKCLMVEELRGTIRLNPTYYGISEKEFTKSIDKLADKIIAVFKTNLEKII